MLTFTIAQLSLTVGDIAGNTARMTAAARNAWAQDADMVIFPELSLTGYYPGDLLDEDGFMPRVEAAMDELLRVSCQFPSLHWVLGLPVGHTGPGKKLRNMLRVIRDGEVLLDYAKQLLPTYDIFDERRHFEPGPDSPQLLDIAGVRIGFLICEDGWNDSGDDYAVNPFDHLRQAAPALVIERVDGVV
ncbi:MAG: NAD+ synthase, partial [Haliea sp.]